ncbi:MAG: hypothetical protein GF331_07530 [Chitinivibrionales bacterium]|nr:hypothetical protein [Chitinivibrionales bacterium]
MNVWRKILLYGGGAAKLGLLKISDVIALLPLRARYALAEACFLVMFVVLPVKRHAVYRNLRLVLGRTPTRRDAVRVFLDYGRYWAEAAHLNAYWRATPKQFEGDPLPSDGSQFIGLTLHVGNFELFGPLLHELRGGRFTVVAEALQPRFLTRYFARKRATYHIRSIPHDAPREVLAALHEGEALGIVCDRAIDGGRAQVGMLGTTLALPVSIIEYAVKHDIAVHVAYIVRNRAGITVHNRCLPRDMEISDTLQAIASTFEEAIRRHPYQWHMLVPVT